MDQQSRKKHFPIIFLFPNIVTLIGLCFGLVAIKCSMLGQLEKAVIFVIIAGFIDGVDGRLARILNASSSFGAQLDSLADFLNFGVAPAFILYLWKGQEIKGFGWAVALFFIICQAIRLARFNASLDDDNDENPLREKYFQGVPAPVGAGLSLTPLMIYFFLKDNYSELSGYITAHLVMVHMSVVALLMVSRIPTISAKKMKIDREFSSLILALAGIIIITLILEPWVAFPIISLIYLCTIPFSVFSYYKELKK